MDRYALKLFLHLSESLHFGRTGRACNISPSALSRQIQRMESEVGHRLLERDNRMVQLTPAGLAFKTYARDVLDKWEGLQGELGELVDTHNILSGEISIFCSVTASLSILPELLSSYKTAYPKVHIRLQTGDAGNAIKKVQEGEVDLAVAPLPDRLPDNMAFKVLAQVSLDFIAPAIQWEFSSELTKKISWQKIPMILSQRGLVRKRIDAWFQQQKIQPNIYAQVSGNEAILSLVSLGCGVGIVPGLVIENSPLRDRIARLKIEPALPPYDVGICVQKRKLKSRPVNAFFEMSE
jgi:LysR family positive regulator for ilvC